METTKLSSRGQIIIPKAIQEANNWQPGVEFIVINTENGVLLKLKTPFAATTIEEVAGCLAYEGPAISQEEMDAAVQKGKELLHAQQIFVPDTVILETEWVLRFAHKFSPEQISNALKKLFGLPNIHLNHAPLIKTTLDWYEAGLDFADALHLAQSQHCDSMLTFEQRFIKHAARITSCPVLEPT